MAENLTELSDDQLVGLCRRRGTEDERLFSELFRRHRQLVWGVCRRYFGNSEDVADMTQEVFFRAFRRLDGFDGGRSESLRAWLARIAANICKNELRRRSRRPRFADEEPKPDRTLWSTTPADEDEARERAARLRRTLSKLPAAQRQILELADLQELPHPQIAAQLGLSLSTVKMRTLRARAALAAAYRAHDSKEGPK